MFKNNLLESLDIIKNCVRSLNLDIEILKN